MLKNFWMDDTGAIVSIEMVVIITVAVLALIVGWSEVAVAVNTELDDISNAVGHLDQSYFFAGFAGFKTATAPGTQKSFYNASGWTDAADDCDLCTGTSTMVCAAGTGAQVGGG